MPQWAVVRFFPAIARAPRLSERRPTPCPDSAFRRSSSPAQPKYGITRYGTADTFAHTSRELPHMDAWRVRHPARSPMLEKTMGTRLDAYERHRERTSRGFRGTCSPCGTCGFCGFCGFECCPCSFRPLESCACSLRFCDRGLHESDPVDLDLFDGFLRLGWNVAPDGAR